MRLLLLALALVLVPHTASARFTDFDFSQFVSTFCGVLESGRVECVSGATLDDVALAPDPDQTFTRVGVGSFFACGITTDGQIECWGDGGEGQTSPPVFDAPVVNLSVGSYHACAIDNAGALKCWGQNVNGQSTPPDTGAAYRDVVATDAFNSCGVKTDGQLDCWGLGNDLFPASIDDESLPLIEQVEHNGNIGCVVRADGTVDCWRRSDGNEVIAEFRDGPYERVFPLDSGDGRSICALTVNGEIDCVNGPPSLSQFNSFPLPFDVNRSTDMYQLTRGTGFFLIGLTFDGRIESIPDGFFGSSLQRVLDTINGELDIETSILNDARYYGGAAGVEIFFEIPNYGSYIGINFDTEVYRNGELIATTDANRSYYDSTAVEGQQYEYTLRLVHVLGQAGEFSNAVSVDTISSADSTDVSLPIPDTSRPDRPAGLRAEIYWFDVELFWDRNTSSNVQAYEIRKNGELVAVTRGTSWYDDSGVSGDNPQYDVLAVGSNNQLLGIDSVSVQIGPAECQ